MPKSLKKPVARKAAKINKIFAPLKVKSKSRAAAPTSTLPSQPETKQDHPGTKTSIILELLVNKTGATITELAAAAKWQEHSVRGFLSGTLKKKRGLSVTTTVVDGVRRYHIEHPVSGQ